MSPVSTPRPLHTVGAVAVGGALGTSARYGLDVAFPHGPDTFPVATFGINVAGSALLAVLLGFVGGASERRGVRLYAGPFLGTGVLGGFTTMSAYGLQVRDLLAAGRPWLGVAYALGSIAVALLAVDVATRVTRAARQGRSA